ncbi:MAG: DUF2851 family protein [Verrucomicrobia bacterium]|nr:DUF2851 family protein [Kiritimatiellia bacterium]MCO6400778.1 DUF2851 family protein [Verrucomicrobiota bacterium]
MKLIEYFPLSVRYNRLIAESGIAREASAEFKSFPYSERHLQCVWYDPVLRPPELRTNEGESVIVEDPGVWNLEAGPDFLGAALRVGAGRRVCGDVEIHIHPGDWLAHQHRRDPRYERVCAHVTFFDGALPIRELPAGALQISLREALARRGGFSFDGVDVATYPYAARAEVPPCQVVLREESVAAKLEMLDAAGQERLRRKAARLVVRLQEVGAAQLLYEETLAVLGYKHNKQPFRTLAERVPLVELQEVCGSNGLSAQAILLGVSGLLPAQLSARWDEAARKHVRGLWDIWIKHRERWADRLMDAAVWRTAGLRPANSPLRRIAAIGPLFLGVRAAYGRLFESPPRSAVSLLKRARAALEGVDDSFWDRRLSLGGKISSAPIALVGADRIQLLVTNVLIPLLAADGRAAPFEAVLAALPPEGDNQLVRQTAFTLFGAHHPTSWYRTGLRRQGLIQIFHDYCLNDRSRCASCTFPELLRRYRSERA